MIIEEIKAVIKINTMDMFRFHLTCAYLRKKGIFAIIFSLLCLAMSILSFVLRDSLSGIVSLVGALLYTVIVPGYLLYKSYMVINKDSKQDKEMFYTINSDRIIVTSRGKDIAIAWESLSRIVETNSQFIIYINRVQGYIIPKRYLDSTIEPLNSLIIEKLEESRFKDYKFNLGKLKSVSIKKPNFKKVNLQQIFKKIISKIMWNNNSSKKRNENGKSTNKVKKK